MSDETCQNPVESEAGVTHVTVWGDDAGITWDNAGPVVREQYA